jgi:hypothetical protein
MDATTSFTTNAGKVEEAMKISPTLFESTNKSGELKTKAAGSGEADQVPFDDKPKPTPTCTHTGRQLKMPTQLTLHS